MPETRTQIEIWESDEPCWACERDNSCGECPLAVDADPAESKE